MLTPQSSGYMPPRQPYTARTRGYWRGSLAGIAAAGPVPAESEYKYLAVLVDSPLYEEAKIDAKKLGAADGYTVYPVRAHSFGFANPPNPPHVGSVDYSWWLVSDPKNPPEQLGWVCSTVLMRKKEPTKPLTEYPTPEDGVILATYAYPVKDEAEGAATLNDTAKVNAHVSKLTEIEREIELLGPVGPDLPSVLPTFATPPDNKPPQDDDKRNEDKAGDKDKKKASSTPWLLVAGIAAVALLMSKRGAG